MNIPADYELLQTLAHQASQLRHHSIANSQMSQTLQTLQQQHKAELDRRDEKIKEQQQRIDDMAARLNAPRFGPSETSGHPCAEEAREQSSDRAGA